MTQKQNLSRRDFIKATSTFIGWLDRYWYWPSHDCLSALALPRGIHSRYSQHFKETTFP